MNKLDVFKIAKILGYSDVEVVQIREKLDACKTVGEKIEREKLYWDAFHELRDALRASHMQELINEVARGKRSFSNDLGDVAKADIDQYFSDVLSGKVEEQEKILKIQEMLAQYQKDKPKI